MSRKPRVVIIPVTASRRSSTALVVVVVPWTMRSTAVDREAGGSRSADIDAMRLVVDRGGGLGDAHPCRRDRRPGSGR